MTMIKEQEGPTASVGSNSSNMSDYLLLFHVASAGLNGDLLGSDEEDIVKLAYLIYDVKRNSVRKASFMYRYSYTQVYYGYTPKVS